MTPHYNDSDLLLPILEELWLQKRLSTITYRAFLHASDRGVPIPRTVESLRYALGEPGTRRLHRIPRLSLDSIDRLRIVFGQYTPEAEQHDSAS